VILHQFIDAMQRFRNRIDWIHRNAFAPEEQKPDKWWKTSLYIHHLILFALVAAVIAGWAILQITPSACEQASTANAPPEGGT
jgi:hypothetical protein